MYILDVIPLSRSLSHDVLSYFSAKNASVGALVTVPLRSSSVTAIIVAVHDLADMKSVIKGNDYALRNITDYHHAFLFDPDFMRACQHVARYYAMPLGSLLSLITQSGFIDTYKDKGFLERSLISEKESISSEVSVYQGPFEERLSHYKRHIRTHISRNESVYIMCPTTQSAEQLMEHVSVGMSHRICLLHSKKTKKQLAKAYEKIRTDTEAIVIIGTPQALSIPRFDIGLFITEEEGSRHYQEMKRPMIDYRLLLRVYARMRNTPHIIAGHILRFETLNTAFQEGWNFIAPPVFHTPKHISPVIVDMTEKKEHESFAILHPYYQEQLQKYIADGDTVCLYVARKGLAPLTLCQDCGEVLRAPDSQNPLVLYEQKNNEGELYSYYYDMRTRTKYKPMDSCPSCGSWKLKMLGIGSRTVEKYMQSLFPHESILRIDGDASLSAKKFNETYSSWKSEGGNIIIATEKIFSYVTDPVDHVFVVSLDALLSLPHYTLHEELLRRLFQTMSMAQKSWMIQTRIPHHPLFEALQSRHIRDLYEKDIQERAVFKYPPSYLIVALENQCSHNKASHVKAIMSEVFKNHTPHFEIRPSRKKGFIIVRGSVRIGVAEWVSPFGAPPDGAPDVYVDIYHRYTNLCDPSYYLRINP